MDEAFTIYYRECPCCGKLRECWKEDLKDPAWSCVRCRALAARARQTYHSPDPDKPLALDLLPEDAERLVAEREKLRERRVLA